MSKGGRNIESPLTKEDHMNTQLLEQTTSMAPIGSVGKELQAEENLIADLNKKWSAAVGKSVQGVLSCSKVVNDAYNELNKGPYQRWLNETCHINDTTASKYRSIHVCPLIQDKTHHHVLPPEMSKMYVLSRISKEKSFSKLKAETVFLEALEFIKSDAPTYEELNAKVNDLIGKKPSDKKPPINATKSVMLHPMPLFGVAAMTPEDRKAAAASFYHGPDPISGKTDLPPAAAPLGESTEIEPTPAEIEVARLEGAAAIEEDDGNDVQFEQFAAAYNTVRLRNEIKAMLKAQGLTNVEVIVRRKVTTVE